MSSDRFPGIEVLASGKAPEPALAQFLDRRRISGTLTGFFAAEELLELTPSGGERPERVPFAALQWLRLTRPVEASRSAEMFRQHGIRVESLQQRSSFSLTFANGQVLSGALYAYGTAFGGLGLYLAEGDSGATRMFVPLGAVDSFSVGERLGESLLERKEITRRGLELALERQRLLRTQRLGGLLLEHGLLTRDQLEKALAEQANTRVKRLGQVLLELGMLSPAQLETALAEQRKNRHKRIGEVLVELGILSAETLHSVLAHKLGIPYVDLRRYAFEPDWGSLAPYAVCRDHAMVPLFRSGDTMAIALADALDLDSLNAISRAVASPVAPALATAGDIAWALEQHPGYLRAGV
jgi:hypothetical protein